MRQPVSIVPAPRQYTGAHLQPLLVKHVALPGLHHKQHDAVGAAGSGPGSGQAARHASHGVVVGHAVGRARSLEAQRGDQVLVHGTFGRAGQAESTCQRWEAWHLATDMRQWKGHALVRALRLAKEAEMVLISTCSSAPVGSSTM